MSRGRRAIRLAALLIFMCDAIRHALHILFGTPEPIEVWMLIADVLIVVLIIWLDLPEWFHKRKCHKIVTTIAPYIERGQEIRQNVPSPEMAERESGVAWMQSVDAWSEETNNFLLTHSRRASLAFQLIAGANLHGGIVYRPNGYSFPVFGQIREHYERLLDLMNNLRGIMEKPDVYF